MGMFDTIKLKMKCPHCGLSSEMEAQTKELDSNLDVWKKGDYIGTKKFNYLECIADCHSNKCLNHVNKKQGYVSGFGRMFDVRIFLDNGIVNGKYKIL